MSRLALTPQQQAYTYLRDEIVSGRFPGGMRLKSAEIAQALGVSRMPVREALRQLNNEGLVTWRVNRGAVVTNLTPQDIMELFEMRAALEGLAARLATGRVTAEAAADLEETLNRMRRLRGERQRWIDAHDGFHDLVCRQSGRRRLCEHIEGLRRQIRPYLLLFAVRNEEPELVGYEHELILDGVRGDDPLRTEQVMRDHIMENARRIVGTLERAAHDSESAVAGRRVSGDAASPMPVAGPERQR